LRDERFLKAMADLDTLINITERNPYAQKIYAEALFNKADIYILLGKYSYAYEHYNKGRRGSHKNKKRLHILHVQLPYSDGVLQAGVLQQRPLPTLCGQKGTTWLVTVPLFPGSGFRKYMTT
jgi:tetratricopeptide (TPR) repeat protein